MMAKNNDVVGIDINFVELKQAAEAFPESGIRWYYLDIFNEAPDYNFDLITFNASFHYFNDPENLLNRCKSLLKPGGEIHIVDSPFYTPEGKNRAKENSLKYFKSLGYEGMTDYYNHITYEVLKKHTYTLNYKPGSFLKKVMRVKDSPFPWICVNS